MLKVKNGKDMNCSSSIIIVLFYLWKMTERPINWQENDINTCSVYGLLKTK